MLIAYSIIVNAGVCPATVGIVFVELAYSTLDLFGVCCTLPCAEACARLRRGMRGLLREGCAALQNQLRDKTIIFNKIQEGVCAKACADFFS